MRWQQQKQQQQQKRQQQHHHHYQQQQQQDSPHPGAAAAAVPPPRLLVALEKRYCFTLRDMDATAPAFDHFLTYLQASETSLAAMPPHEQQRLHNQQQQQQQQKRKVLFRGERLDVQSIPQVSSRASAALGRCDARLQLGLFLAALPCVSTVVPSACTSQELLMTCAACLRHAQTAVAAGAAAVQALQYDRSEFLELWELTLLP
jgi:hypothetical protein